MNLLYETNNLCDPLPRPHFFFRMCVNGIERYQSHSLSPNDSYWIIIRMKRREFDVVFSMWRDWKIDLAGVLSGKIEVHERNNVEAVNDPFSEEGDMPNN